MSVAIPLANVAETGVRDLEHMTKGARLGDVDGATLLGERAMLGGFHIPARVSAGGGCRLYNTRTGLVALNLARPDDRHLLPALFEADAEFGDDEAVARYSATRDAADLVSRGRLLGLAIAGENEAGSAHPAVNLMTSATPALRSFGRAPRILDLSALWAGPLASHLLSLAGADVTKVESRTRPDAMRYGDAAFFALLNQGKASVVLDLTDMADRAALRAMIARSDIVIEAARPRALEQLGIEADDAVRTQPGLTWITITGHGADGDAAHWIGFGDDCGIAAGLGAALRNAGSPIGFVGDAIADPLTGICAARVAWEAWASGRGGRYGIAMSGVVAAAIARARQIGDFDRALVDWAAAAGTPFPKVRARSIARVSPLGADTRDRLAQCSPC